MGSQADYMRKRAPEDFEMGEPIGDGSYSTVLRAVEKDTGQEFAVKVLDKRHIVKNNKTKYVHVEKDVLNRLNGHQFVVRLYYTFQDQASLYFVLDYAKNGDMLECLKKYGSFDHVCARFYVAEIVAALEYVHGKDVIHRDLKPENILLGEDMHIMLTDFGTAKVLVGPEASRSQGADVEKTRATSFVGTAEYVSPELLKDKNATRSSDFWALGCVTYQLLCGRPPFQAKTDYMIFQKILGLDYAFPDGVSEPAKDFVSRLLEPDPVRRLGSDTTEGGGYSGLKGHTFFEGINWTMLGTERPPKISTGIAAPKQATTVDTTDFVDQLNGLLQQTCL